VIGKLTGRLDYRAADHALIDVGGVGYIVHCSERTLAALPRPGGVVAVYTELLVREDLMQLFGFLTLAEREWHRLLVSVQGVGAKAALAMLGALGVEGVARAVSLGDAAAIRRAPGVGPKIAQRVILELQAKAPSVMAMGAEGARPAMAAEDGAVIETVAVEPTPEAATSGMAGAEAQSDALSALVNLGYVHGEAAAAVARAAAENPEMDSSALIRAALRAMAPKG